MEKIYTIILHNSENLTAVNIILCLFNFNFNTTTIALQFLHHCRIVILNYLHLLLNSNSLHFITIYYGKINV